MAWKLSPPVLLAVFCGTSLLVYVDRGAIGSNGVDGDDAIPGDFGLTALQNGLLPAAFMVGLMVASSVFAEAAKHGNPLRLIGVGLSIWCAAVAGCGMSWSFVPLLLCRCAVGAGEAAYVNLAAPFIDDYAPPRYKSLWLALLYECIPVGYALGYILGGVIGTRFGWRAVFFVEASVMLPFIVTCFGAKPLPLRMGNAAVDAEEKEGGMGSKAREMAADVGRLLRRPPYVCVVIGNTIHTAVLGTYAFWGPKAANQLFSLHNDQADLIFGAVTVLTGVAGTIAGGLLLDHTGANVRAGMVICSVGTGVGCVMLLLACSVASTLTTFVLCFAIGEFFLFIVQAPVGAMQMWSVPLDLRPLACSFLTVCIHLFGDVPAPPLLGWIRDAKLLTNWRALLAVFTLPLLAAHASFVSGFFLAKQGMRDGDGNAIDDGEHHDATAIDDNHSHGVDDANAVHVDDGAAMRRHGSEAAPLLPQHSTPSAAVP